jgi:hypothetical protein
MLLFRAEIDHQVHELMAFGGKKLKFVVAEGQQLEEDHLQKQIRSA